MTIDPTSGGGQGWAALADHVKEQKRSSCLKEVNKGTLRAPGLFHWCHAGQGKATERPPFPTGKGAHLPGEVLLGPWGCRQVDAQHYGVGRGGEDAGNDGISHVEGKHGVHHEDDKEEERHLQREEKQCQKIPAPLPLKETDDNNMLIWETASQNGVEQTHWVITENQAYPVGKALALEVWGPEIESQEPCKSGYGSHTVLQWDRKWTLEACRQEVDTWKLAYRPASLAWVVEPNKRLCVKAEIENQGLSLFFVLHICHCMHTGMHIHRLTREKEKKITSHCDGEKRFLVWVFNF